MTDPVKRYGIAYYTDAPENARMSRMPEGGYVKFSDHVQLEAENANLRELLKACDEVFEIQEMSSRTDIRTAIRKELTP